MRIASVVLLVVGLCFGGYAQAQDASRRALAEELLNEMDMKANMEKSFAMFKKMLPAQMEQMKKARAKAGQAPATDQQPAEATDEHATKAAEKMMDEMAEQLSWDNIKDDFIALYAETFTEEELRGLVEFYKSPAGRAFTKKQPELMKRSMQLTQKRMLQWMPRMQEMQREAMGAAHKRPKGPPAPAAEPPSDGK